MFQLQHKFTTFLIFFFLSINSYADSVAATTLNQLLSKIHTIRADFTQTITDKNAKAIQESTGQMSVERPGKFRWEVTKPVSQLVVTNGSRLWIYDPDLEQVTIRLLSKEVGESPARLLSDTTNSLDKDFIVEMTKKNAEISFLLKPKSENSMFASIKLGFVKDELRDMVLQDRIGHTTAVEFYNITLNPTLAASLFAFKAPKNVDVIDETRH